MEFVAVARQFETLLTHEILLKPLDRFVVKFEDVSAGLADHVIVMIALPGLEARLPIAKMTDGSQPRLDEEFQSSIDGRVADGRVGLANLAMKLFDADMPRGSRKHFDDQLALSRRA
jgi:hypothetical protein